MGEKLVGKYFRNYLLKYVDDAKAFYKEEYLKEINPNKTKSIISKLRAFDDLKDVYENGFEQANMKSQFIGQHFYQTMKAAENRVMIYKRIHEQENK